MLSGAAIAATAGAASASASAKDAAREAGKNPLNIVYIMTDDHTSQMMSCYDTRYATLPTLTA